MLATERTTNEERSIRQRFAGQALQGLLTRWGAQDSRDGQPDPRTMEDIVTQAYGLADLMIEREKKLK